jgi:bifunctional UDP-N-acetylglucosamine pyrophosphorylase/glucosamine-1-phosphate N-acetyltransferase
MTAPLVLVLAGGASNRFWPLEDKPFFPFAGACLLERHLRMLHDLGCERFLVVVRPGLEERARQIGAGLGIPRLQTVVQEESTGMAGALLAAGPQLEAAGDAALYVTQSQDVVSRALHREMLAALARGDAFATVAAARVGDYFPGGYLAVEAGRITSIVEKPGAGNEPGDLVNIVAHAFASFGALLAAVRAEFSRDAGDDAYERALASLMGEHVFRPAVYEGRWEALKYPWQVLEVMGFLLAEWAAGEEQLPEGYDLREDGVIMGRDVRIFPGSHVVAPVLIGHRAVIGHNALVRGSILGEGAVAGFGSEVARSYVGDGVELHHNYVGDSVMAAGSSMGFGATTANYRLDGRTVPSTAAGQRIDTGREKLGAIIGAGAKVGVNTSLMPGVKIGAGAIIGPNLRINRDVPANERVLYDDEYGRF